jgi:DNA invertase Pin-like site-specific DNA recombinase
VAFLSRLLEAGVDVRFADLPQIEGATGRFLLQQMVAVAELEAGMISKRTKDALAAAKKRGDQAGRSSAQDHGEDAKGKPIYGAVANGSPAARKASLRARQAHADQRAGSNDQGTADGRRSQPEGHCRWAQCPSHPDCPWCR